jgi:hypothetical protein
MLRLHRGLPHVPSSWLCLVESHLCECTQSNTKQAHVGAVCFRAVVSRVCPDVQSTGDAPADTGSLLSSVFPSRHVDGHSNELLGWQHTSAGWACAGRWHHLLLLWCAAWGPLIQGKSLLPLLHGWALHI